MRRRPGSWSRPTPSRARCPPPRSAAAIAAGLRGAGGEAEECPVADGGEGTIEILRATLGGELRSAPSHDALGRPLQADWLWLAEEQTAILEMARASGLALIEESERDAERASSAGTGELILAARDAGASRAILAIGGTATSDGGAGALGAIEQARRHRRTAARAGLRRHDPLRVRRQVFGPQKGASPRAGRTGSPQRLHELAAGAAARPARPGDDRRRRRARRGSLGGPRSTAAGRCRVRPPGARLRPAAGRRRRRRDRRGLPGRAVAAGKDHRRHPGPGDGPRGPRPRHRRRPRPRLRSRRLERARVAAAWPARSPSSNAAGAGSTPASSLCAHGPSPPRDSSSSSPRARGEPPSSRSAAASASTPTTDATSSSPTTRGSLRRRPRDGARALAEPDRRTGATASTAPSTSSR